MKTLYICIELFWGNYYFEIQGNYLLTYWISIEDSTENIKNDVTLLDMENDVKYFFDSEMKQIDQNINILKVPKVVNSRIEVIKNAKYLDYECIVLKQKSSLVNFLNDEDSILVYEYITNLSVLDRFIKKLKYRSEFMFLGANYIEFQEYTILMYEMDRGGIKNKLMELISIEEKSDNSNLFSYLVSKVQ